jgi:hypothetical protein
MTSSTLTSSTTETEKLDAYEKHERRGYQAWTNSLPAGPVKTVVSKLFTNEDHLQIHKTLGILSVVSFLYRYFVVYPAQGNLGFDGRLIDHLTILLHFLLSCSSIIFHVISRRIANRPMIIWEEYRLHAIVFSTRCVSVYLYGYFQPFAGTDLDRVALIILVLLHHVMADKITEWYGSKNGITTVRVHDQHRSDITAVLRFYAFYQFAALSSHVVPNARLSDLGFNTFIAIQSSAFLMTLYRKSIITEVSHAFWYTVCLVISLYHIFSDCGSPFFFAKLSAAYFLRTEMKLNKYVLWSGFALLSFPEVEQAIITKSQEFIAGMF